MNFSTDKILITGAAGSIGSALSNRIADLNPKQLVLLDNNESGLFEIYEEVNDRCNADYVVGDIRDTEWIYEIFKKYKFDIVYHAAAYKHVVLMEKYPIEAVKTNIEGLLNILHASEMIKIKKFIFISSDKAVNPTSYMGKTKKEGERYCKEYNKHGLNCIIVRFGNVMASRGSVVPIFQKAITEGKDLEVTDKKMKRYFMGIYEAVDLILEATRLGRGGETFVLDMGKPMEILQLAQFMIKLSGKDLKIKFSKANKGEKFDEQLMTLEESKRAKKVGKLWIIK